MLQKDLELIKQIKNLLIKQLINCKGPCEPCASLWTEETGHLQINSVPSKETLWHYEENVLRAEETTREQIMGDSELVAEVEG